LARTTVAAPGAERPHAEHPPSPSVRPEVVVVEAQILVDWATRLPLAYTISCVAPRTPQTSMHASQGRAHVRASLEPSAITQEVEADGAF
jgi:hypothetical protein